jgi:hypothetical protein
MHAVVSATPLAQERVLDRTGALVREAAAGAPPELALALVGLLLFGIGVFAALARRRLDALHLGLFVAGVGVTLVAVAAGRLGGAPAVGAHTARLALGVALLQAISGLALARRTAAALRRTRTDELERLRG